MVTTGNCLYYTPAYALQRLDATANDGVTDQTTVGSYRLGLWNTAAGGNGTAASWYEGNIQTCVSKSMRLPTLYETAVADPGGLYKPTDAAPTFNAANGIPSAADVTWTASSSYDIFNYWVWSGSVANSYLYNWSNYVRCVLP
jgi:hypothetical protein